MVEYLIGVGAHCEANTFDGERCLYGALTDSIRKILMQHSLVTAHTIRRDAYEEFLRRWVFWPTNFPYIYIFTAEKATLT